jgi:hypothetical protein
MNFVATYWDIFSEHNQTASLYNYQILDSLCGLDEDIIMELIKSDMFNCNYLADIPDSKKNFASFSGTAFDFLLLTKDHFKRWDKSQLYSYLDTCTNGLPWSQSEFDTFQKEANWVKSEIDKCQSDFFLFISMDWFDANGMFVNKANTHLSTVMKKWDAIYDPVLYGNAHIYVYYMTFFWVDREHSIVTMCELLYD